VLASWQVYAGTLNTLLSPILRGIYDAARSREVNILMACGVISDFSSGIRAAWPLNDPDVDFLPVGMWNTDGLIIIAPSQSGGAQSVCIREMQQAGHPLVFAETAEMGPAVCLDNATGIRDALEHLKSHGHRRIAFIGAEENGAGDGQERLQAFLDFNRAHRLPEDPRLLAYGHFTNPGGYAAMQQILASGATFSAVLACNDECAVGAMQALREAGKRIPQDVAVIGFDNRFESRNQSPPLTTVNLPAYEIGWQSLELMLERLAGQASEKTILRVPSQLVIRESCGCRANTLPAENPSTDVEWSEAISAAVFAQTGQLHLENIRQLTAGLVESFSESITSDNFLPFQRALNAILAQVNSLDEDAHAWQVAIHLLRHRWLAGSKPGPNHLQVLEWLDQARMAISECAQTQLLRYFARQSAATQQLSLMSADLSEAVELAPLQSILDRYIENLGIHHAKLVLFEPDSDDPLAWSVLPGAESSLKRFPTRSFPPAALYPDSPPWQLALLPLLVQKQPAGFIAFDAANLYPCLAVARQVASTLESIRLYREAAEGRQLAEEANRLKSRFLSTVSHELRTPLNLIVGWSEMLLNDPGADAARFAGHIHTSAQHLGRLIRDVLDLASSDAGQLRLTCEPLDLSETLQMVAETGRQMAAEKGLDWQAELPAGLPRIWGDRTRLQQITLNLVSNAVKFTSRGQVALRIVAEGGWLSVSVQDTGLGIAPEEQPWIFDEFRQSERTTTRGYGGLGLGLAICKRLVELHNGEVGVSSSGEEGSGSTFFFRLPVLDSAEASAPNPRSGSVLILTSRPDSSDPIRARLERGGFAVLQQSVDDNPDWLSSVLVSPPGAVVLDETLAVQYGWELLKVLKGNPHTANIPVLFYALEGESGSMLALDYLMKPVGAGDLIQALKRQGWAGRPQGGEQTILIADDDPGMLEMNSRLIQDQFPRHHVLKASDGRAALEILSKTPVQLVLLDLMMPEVDGFGVLAQMREWDKTRDTAVIVLTSKSLTEADMARLNQGVAMVMGKGLYAASEMLAHVEATLGRNPRLGSDSQRMARKAMAYIHEHFAAPITREELARHVNASDGHLARCFRQETGLSPMAYLNRYRVRQAQTRLAGSQQSVTAIALACGFSDVNYFSRVFHQETGMTPLAYRKLNRSQA
jgi:signal transduction histidine kinase/DNA-binding response OmpR family regulator/ABC-type sugar transport system substrate-binding protein